MLLFPEKAPADWLPKVLADLPAVLVDHAHLERKAATTALNLEKYRDLFPRVEELNSIAIEHLICCRLIEGRSCEKFQMLAAALQPIDRELSDFYQGLVESEGYHYAT